MGLGEKGDINTRQSFLEIVDEETPVQTDESVIIILKTLLNLLSHLSHLCKIYHRHSRIFPTVKITRTVSYLAGFEVWHTSTMTPSRLSWKKNNLC